jgi:hypothetical protein
MTTVKVTVELVPEFHAYIENLIRKNPWLGFESVEQFLEEAARLYVQRLVPTCRNPEN